ncbi:MAG: N-acetylmuramoyl-L-alanine amidase family protein [Hungatella sp.]
MRNNKRTPYIVLLTAFLLAVTPLISFAAKKPAETRTPIQAVSINVTSYLEEGDAEGHLEVEANSNAYSVGNVEWSNLPTDGWTVGFEPKAKIYLHARSGYYFDKAANKKTIVVNGATFSTVKREDNDETMLLTVTLNRVQGELEFPEEVEWVGYPIGQASWKAVPNAKAYELKLYQENQIIYSVEKSVGTKYDFYPYMTTSGNYKFRVRAVPVSSAEAKYVIPSEWVYSDETNITYDETADARYQDGASTTNKVQNPSQMGWVETADGWWYRNANGSYPVNQWLHLDNKWYYCSYDGYMLTGWQKIGGATYYFSGNGDMQVGWLEYDRQWYFLNPANGQMMTGWNLSNNRWYYMSPQTGVMQTGWALINNKWYYLDPNSGGAMLTNTTIGGYPLNSDGVWVR